MKHNVYKNILTKSCFEKDEKEIKAKMGSKCTNIVNDDFKVQDYMRYSSLNDTRDIFRIKTRMNHLRGNFSSVYKNKGEEAMFCVGCKSVKETNSHVTECAIYADLMEGRDLRDDGDLVSFFRDVMARREKIEKASRV